MSEQMKAVVFEGVTYRVPIWVNWMARDQDGQIGGYELDVKVKGKIFISPGRYVSILRPTEDESWRNSAARV